MHRTICAHSGQSGNIFWLKLEQLLCIDFKATRVQERSALGAEISVA